MGDRDASEGAPSCVSVVVGAAAVEGAGGAGAGGGAAAAAAVATTLLETSGIDGGEVVTKLGCDKLLLVLVTNLDGGVDGDIFIHAPVERKEEVLVPEGPDGPQLESLDVRDVHFLN